MPRFLDVNGHTGRLASSLWMKTGIRLVAFLCGLQAVRGSRPQADDYQESWLAISQALSSAQEQCSHDLDLIETESKAERIRCQDEAQKLRQSLNESGQRLNTVRANFSVAASDSDGLKKAVTQLEADIVLWSDQRASVFGDARQIPLLRNLSAKIAVAEQDRDNKTKTMVGNMRARGAHWDALHGALADRDSADRKLTDLINGCSQRLAHWKAEKNELVEDQKLIQAASSMVPVMNDRREAMLATVLPQMLGKLKGSTRQSPRSAMSDVAQKLQALMKTLPNTTVV
jgi:septal ring factor EnvC (AmiA/AmiB activator)